MALNNKIWWIASYPKSGNTWIRAFFSAYRNGGSVDINSMRGANVDDIQEYYYQTVSPVSLEKLGYAEGLLLRDASLLHLVNSSPAGVPLLVKTHNQKARLFERTLIPPQLTHGAIYIIRDPRDVAISFSTHCNLSIDETIERMERNDFVMPRDHLAHFVGSWSQHVKSWSIDNSPFKTALVRYEDLVDNPTGTFEFLIKFLHMEFSEDLYERSIDNTFFSALKKQEEEHGFRERKQGERFFNFGTYGQWKDILTEEQNKRIISHHEEMMKEWNYEV